MKRSPLENFKNSLLICPRAVSMSYCLKAQESMAPNRGSEDLSGLLGSFHCLLQTERNKDIGVSLPICLSL